MVLQSAYLRARFCAERPTRKPRAQQADCLRADYGPDPRRNFSVAENIPKSRHQRDTRAPFARTLPDNSLFLVPYELGYVPQRYASHSPRM